MSYFLDKKNWPIIASAFLIIIYSVGLVGLCSSWQAIFLLLTATNLYLSLAILLAFHKQWNRAFVFFSLICFVLGLSVEILGVATGLIFGNYHYGASLGSKILSVPIVIGANWLMLIYCCGTILQNVNLSIFFKALIGAFAMVLLDILIEPVAMKLDFWQWQNNIIPIQNYIAWFFISLFLLLVFHSLSFNKQNFLAKILLIIQFSFFAMLNIFLS